MRSCPGSRNLERRRGTCSGAGALDVTPPGRPTREVGRPEGGTHQSFVVSLGRDHGQGLHKGCRVFLCCFSCRSWGVDCWKSRWKSHGRCGGYGFGFSLVSHGLMMVGCCWNQWRFWGIDGNEVEGLGFLRRGRSVRDYFSRCETPSSLMELDSRWVKEAVQLGRTGAFPGSVDLVDRPTQAGPQWAPACTGQ